MRSEPVLVTGATGYVGGRLVPLLLESGHRIRVMGRSLSKLQCRPWAADPGASTRGSLFRRGRPGPLPDAGTAHGGFTQCQCSTRFAQTRR